MRSTVRAMAVVLTTTALSAMVACSDPQAGDSSRGDRPDDTKASRAKDTIDLVGDLEAEPPQAFEQEAAHTISMGSVEQPPIAFFGKAAWLVDEAGMTVVDLESGEEVRRVEPENPALYEATALEDMNKKDDDLNALASPQMAHIGDKPVVLATIPVKLESKGNPSRKGVEVIAVRAKDAKVLWRLPVQLHGDLEGRLAASVWRPPYKGKAAVQWGTAGVQGTFVVDLNKPGVLWQRTDFWVTAGYQDVLVGFRTEHESSSLAGVALSNGVELWDEQMAPGEYWTLGSRYGVGRGGGPWTVVEDDKSNPLLMKMATGETALTEEDGLSKFGSSGMSCEMGEGGSVLLCASEKDGALALDAETEKVLWKRPGGKGSKAWSGTISETYQDRAYIDRGANLAIVDARTGETVRTDTGIVPDWVTPYAGLVRTDEGIEVHPAQP